jgi:hypothetical protein
VSAIWNECDDDVDESLNDDAKFDAKSYGKSYVVSCDSDRDDRLTP